MFIVKSPLPVLEEGPCDGKAAYPFTNINVELYFVLTHAIL